MAWGDDVEAALRDASELGFLACEPRLEWLWGSVAVPGTVERLMARYGLTISSLYLSIPSQGPTEGWIEEVELVATRVADLGATDLVFGPAGPRRSTEDDGANLRRLAVSVGEAAARCTSHGLRASFHSHLWTDVETEEELDQIMCLAEMDQVSLALDTAHLHLARMSPIDVAQRYRRRLGIVHLKDAIGGSKPSGAPKADLFRELGRGEVDLVGMIRVLRQMKYSGWVLAELDRSDDPRESARVSVAYMVQQLGMELEI
ncbi:MAG: sugar phosphate isomerase/epimerase family protein [Candidatus Dormibacteria bacterium]